MRIDRGALVNVSSDWSAPPTQKCSTRSTTPRNCASAVRDAMKLRRRSAPAAFQAHSEIPRIRFFFGDPGDPGESYL
jgi:hypothetical protein